MANRKHAEAAPRKSAAPSAPMRSAKAAMAARPIDDVCIDTIRTLSMDAVQKAESGHPGAPMALAPVIYTLWRDALRTIRKTRHGSTGTVSSCPTDTRRCCFTRRCIWRA